MVCIETLLIGGRSDSMAVTDEDDKFRISLESLQKYTPLLQEGLKAQEILDEKYGVDGQYVFDSPSSISIEHNNVNPSDIDQVLEVSTLEAKYYRGQFAGEKLIEQATPLLHSEVAKISARAQFHDPEEVHSVLFYEARNGLMRGLAKYDHQKNKGSVTNYLFQWATTYARRELNKLEAPFGVPPSRYEKYRKISAVRSKLTEELGRYATNEEVHSYFISGSADIRTLNGPVHLRGRRSSANQNMDLKLVEDQEYFEKHLAYTRYLQDENYDFYPENIASGLGTVEEQSEKSLFKEFVELHDFRDEAVAVIFNEAQIVSSDAPPVDVSEIKDDRYRAVMKEWRALVREKEGLFHLFIREKVESDDISGYDFDLRKLLEILDGAVEPKGRIGKKYSLLFFYE